MLFRQVFAYPCRTLWAASVSRIGEELKPDVMVVDVAMPIMGGIEAAKRLEKLYPEGKIVFMSVYGAPAIIEEALSTGALGYVLKVSADDDLVEALREALQGRSFLSPALRSSP
jgi:DNA-binding NarL/FixJ family response regulator